MTGGVSYYIIFHGEEEKKTKDDIVPLNSLTKHSRNLKFHEQKMVELVCKTQLST